MMENELFYPEGFIKFAYIDKIMQYQIQEYPDFYSYLIHGDLMTGEEFYDCVDCGSIINYDGILAEVFVNGYRSNLGLCHKGLSQGGFMVDGPTWLEMCEDCEIIVEWCNK